MIIYSCYCSFLLLIFNPGNSNNSKLKSVVKEILIKSFQSLLFFCVIWLSSMKPNAALFLETSWKIFPWVAWKGNCFLKGYTVEYLPMDKLSTVPFETFHKRVIKLCLCSLIWKWKLTYFRCISCKVKYFSFLSN